MKKRIPTILATVLVMVLLFSLGLTALAASGNVSFNQVSVRFDGLTVFKKGEPLETTAGEEIPSTITYTDARGALTTYVPLRSVGEVLHMPVRWDPDFESITLNLGSELEVYTYPLYRTDITINHLFSEVTPITPESGAELLPSTDYQSLDTAFWKELTVDRSKGRYVSVTVTNHSDQTLVFGWGCKTGDDGYVLVPGQLPGGQTVTRTIEMSDQSEISSAPFFFSVGHGGYLVMPVDITVSAVQFDVK